MTTAKVKNGKVRIPRQYGYRARLIRFGLVLFCCLFVLHHYYPAFDVPYVPGISCASGSAEAAQVSPDGGGDPEGGLTGGAYVTGRVLRDLSRKPPSPDDVRAALMDGASEVGRLTGGFRAAWDGAAPPVKEAEAEEPAGVVPAGTGNPCAPCPGVNAVPAAQGTDGIETAARAVLRAGWTGQDAVTAVAVAGPESGYRADAENASSSAKGMWQTMMSYHAAKFGGDSWADPYANARVAHEIWQDAGGWSPWVGYTSGAYRAYLDRAAAAIAKVQGSGSVQAVAAVSAPQKGLQPVAVQASNFVRAQFGFRGTIGGFATGGHIAGSKHYEGLAIDIMVPLGAEADRIANYFAGPGYKAFNVENVIHNHRIFNEGRGWHAYPERGNPTLNHEDHVHVDFRSGGAVKVATPSCAAGGGTVGASWSQTTSGREFALATFNVLGASHTGAASAVNRMQPTVRALAAHHVDIVGLQEFQRGPQTQAFDRLAGGTFARWSAPGDTENSVAWRRSQFRLVDSRLIAVPYFEGRPRMMPAVRLQHVQTGQRLWVFNVHNPADTREHPGQGVYRARAVRVELATLETLRRTGDPVFMTGDMNAREAFGDPMRAAGMVPAGGGTYRGIDWVLGSPGQSFSAHTVDDSRLVDRATDHPLVVARVRLVSGLTG